MLSKETSIAPSSLLLRDWAIFYASMNLPIIPLYEPTINGQCSCYNPACSSPGKHPRTVNGLKDASTDILTIQSWWNKWPKANIGIITGKLSGKIVIDIDPKNGGLTSLEHLEEIYSDIPGAKVKTGGNGFHFYLEHPITKMIKNKVNIMPGIDIRGDGGYIVAPPSTHYTGGVYEWLSPISNSVNIPEWFFNLYDQNHSIEKNTSKKLTIESGGRNNFLTSVAGSLKKHGLDRDAIQKSLDFLNQEFCIPRLNITELLSITKSIERYNADSIIEWESPLEIKPKDIDIYPIDSTYLPEVIKEWVIDIATRMQVSFELIAVPAIVAIGSVIGRKIRIYPKKHDNWVVTPNLWGAIVAKPGMLKSPAISEALAPLEAIVRYENSR
ncbi:MAG: DUF3987 domain-containing protein, partial [Gammaproteobacteria bacterium]|nr:DUF3987 domain-containing protein [Gammaproteobacteria bacterium]